MSVDFSDLIVAAVSSASAIVAIFISASIARNAERERHKRQFLTEAYSNVLIRYTRWLDIKDSNNKAALIASIAQARLLASSDTEPFLKDFERAVIENAATEELGKKLGPLRHAMRAELDQKSEKRHKKQKEKKNAH
jgi:hypothetical protein